MEQERLPLSRVALVLAFCIMYRVLGMSHFDSNVRQRGAVQLALLSETFGAHYSMNIHASDVLILAGDVIPIPPNGLSGSTLRGWYLNEYSKLDTWLGSDPIITRFPHRIVVWGDRDIPFLIFHNESPILQNAVVLFDSSTMIMGLKFYGTSWQPQNKEGAFYLPRGSVELQAKRKMIGESDLLCDPSSSSPSCTQIDVLISHSPPAGFGDHPGTLPNDFIAKVLTAEMELLNATKEEEKEKARRTLEKVMLEVDERLPLKLKGVHRGEEERWGCGLLASRIAEVHPRVVVVGQNAESYGEYSGRAGLVLNAALSSPEHAAAKGQVPLRHPHHKRPRDALYRSMLRTQSYPKLKGVEVPFIIE